MFKYWPVSSMTNAMLIPMHVGVTVVLIWYHLFDSQFWPLSDRLGIIQMLSYDTANFQPQNMKLRLLLDGSSLLETSNPNGDVGVILDSPHEKPVMVFLQGGF